MKAWIGVDVSKSTLDVCWFNNEAPVFFKISNDIQGFKILLSKLPENPHIVMEATGTYYLRFANFLFDHSLTLSVVNPLSVKRFAQMKLARAKTDKYDSAIIAEYGASQNPAPWSMPEPKILEMQQLYALEDLLIVQKGMLSNQNEAFSQNPFASQTALKSINGLVKNMEREIEKVKKDIAAIMNEHYSREMEILCSIPGIGEKTAQVLIIAARGFKSTNNGRQLCSYVGIAPRPHQSGTSVKARGRISKMGNGNVRKILYMCSMSAKASNPACKVFYERLIAKGKPGKVALVAVEGKLIRQAVAMIKSNKLYDEKLAMGA